MGDFDRLNLLARGDNTVMRSRRQQHSPKAATNHSTIYNFFPEIIPEGPMTTIYLEIPEMEVRPKHGQTSPSDSKGEKHDTPHNEPERVREG